MKEKKDDRRSQRTRDLLRGALFTLMQQKRYDSITVQDIIDLANVGRSTFYAHFVDKEDLTISSMEAMFESLTRELNDNHPAEQKILSTTVLFRHIQDEYHIFYPFLRGRGMELFFEMGQSYLCRKVEKNLCTLIPQAKNPALPLSVVSNYVAGTFITLIKWWMDNKMPYSPERMDEIFQQLVMPGVWAALGNKAS